MLDRSGKAGWAHLFLTMSMAGSNGSQSSQTLFWFVAQFGSETIERIWAWHTGENLWAQIQDTRHGTHHVNTADSSQVGQVHESWTMMNYERNIVRMLSGMRG